MNTIRPHETISNCRILKDGETGREHKVFINPDNDADGDEALRVLVDAGKLPAVAVIKDNELIASHEATIAELQAQVAELQAQVDALTVEAAEASDA